MADPEYYTVGNLDSPNGWITGDGEFLACGYRAHLYAVEEYFGKDNGRDAEDLAEKDGWIKITDFKVLVWGCRATLKQRQIDTLWDWYSLHQPKYGSMIKYYPGVPFEGMSFDEIVRLIQVYMRED